VDGRYLIINKVLDKDSASNIKKSDEGKSKKKKEKKDKRNLYLANEGGTMIII
jgi:hypothetical protein